jgi:molybdopterin-containing oxidoreductase family iron-sulfur binding subunit
MIEDGKTYWRSLEELANTPQFEEWLHREFPVGASELLDSKSRRTILKLMGASFGLAGLTACRRPVEKTLPVAKGVEDFIPGTPLHYNTAMALGGAVSGLRVETHEGRPTKIEGNPDHPASVGAASAFAQASILNLYDPDRAKHVRKNGAPSSWEEFAAFAQSHFAGDCEGLRFLSQQVVSPSLEAVKAHAMKRFPKAKWVQYEPVSLDETMAGAVLAFGQPLNTHYRFEKADVVLSLDADFLGLDNTGSAAIRDFSRRRKITTPKQELNRLYVVESHYSITGASADHRLRMRVSDLGQFCSDLAAELGVSGDTLKVLPGTADVRQKWLAAVARDLTRHKGRSLVVAGPRQPAIVHAWVHLLNQLLGNAGETVAYTASSWEPQLPALKELAGEMAAGSVSTLVILGGNPVYDAPADLQLSENVKKVKTVIRLGLDDDETSALAAWQLLEAHYLESWSDARAADGTCSIQQPMIQPLYDGKTPAEIVGLISGYKDQRAYTIVRNLWTAQWSGDSEKTWRKSLHDGIVLNTRSPEVKVQAKRPAGIALQSAPGLEVGFYPSSSAYDGRFANNGWMQEAPDQMTKLTWDNVALLSPATARRLQLAAGDLITLEQGGRSITVPVLEQPGHADSSISVALGYGRTKCGRIAKGVGYNVYPLRTVAGLHFTTGVNVKKTGGKYKLSVTQEHHSMEGRPIVREASLEEYRKEPGFAQKEAPKEMFSLFKEQDYEKGNQWGLAIDLNSCIGCNACVVACQAENNIPIVGKDQVSRGREMHWIRLDRYFEGPDEDPKVVYQPMACQQCENAPCEAVCPVAATNHSPEGLNDMAYNRCVGTRYCANNCPYKVRRFNFLEWNKDMDAIQKMAFNPDVSVRVRGVMEKCTYCVQRIQEAKIHAKADGRRTVRDGEIVTACQQTCPAEAITFGNINDPNSKVSKLKKLDRNYAVLAELNVKPRTSYLAKVRNPNPELA